jgi:LytS/YehU family sensor histidine kinase
MVEFPLHIIMVYLNIYVLVPKYIQGKKYRTYFLLLALLLMIHFFVREGLDYYLVSENIWPEALGLHEPFGFNHVVNVVLGEIYVIGLVSAIKFTVDHTIQLNKNAELIKIQSQTELKYLKNQIQPHFFFNTLNSLYALTLQQSEKASSVVLKLSKIMEYIIYEADKKKVPLLKEIGYIQNYVELEKIRSGDLVHFNLEIEGNINDTYVPPMLFLPFLENCFKHGGDQDHRINISMAFSRLNDHLSCSITNNYDSTKQQYGKSGIGIKNTKRRLELLFGNNYELNKNECNNTFNMMLRIPLL